MRRFRDQRLYDRGGRFIWARLRDEHGKTQRISTKCTDEKAASLFSDEWERRAADPAYRRAAEATIESAIVDWLTELRRRQVSSATFSIAKTKAGHFVRLWGGSWPLLRVDNDLVLKYIDTREGEGVKPLTVKKELGALKGFLEWARFRGTFPRDLATVIPPRYSGRHKPRTRAPTPEEVVRLLLQLEPRRGAHVAYIVATGARLAESFRARRADAEIVALRVRLRGTKTDLASGSVPVTGLTHPFLAFALQHAPGKDLLFDPWGKYWRDIRAACVRAEIDPVSPNDLRRAFGKWHRLAGASAEEVGLLLRHATDTLAQTTYAKVSALDIGDRLRVLSPVPNLYAANAASRPIQPNPQSDDMGKQAPPAVIETATFGLGNLTPADASSRRSVGVKKALARLGKARVVPILNAPRDAFRAAASRWLARPAPVPPPLDSNDDVLDPLRRWSCP